MASKRPAEGAAEGDAAGSYVKQSRRPDDKRGLGRPDLKRREGDAPRLPKRKLALLLGYRGAAYFGLQKQTDQSLPTIERELVRAIEAAGAVSEANAGDLTKIGWSRSARTDKRVSAAQNVVAAKLEVEGDDVDALVGRLNDALPDDIRVFDAARVVKGFNCKQACDKRRYTYLLPAACLAPDAVLDAAFAAAGYGPDVVAGIRADPDAPWSMAPAAVAAVAASLADYRCEPAAVARLRAFLAGYVGTRRYHNFTNKLKGTDGQAQRFIVSFVAADPTAPGGAGGAEWLRLDVVGQSFLLHMIRKMVAVASEAARADRGDPAALLDGLTDANEAVPLQLVPGDGLYLGAPVFETYNKFKASPPERPALEWGADHPKHAAIEAFRTDVVEAGIVRGGAATALEPFVTYLWNNRVFGFPLAPTDPFPISKTEKATRAARAANDGGDPFNAAAVNADGASA